MARRLGRTLGAAGYLLLVAGTALTTVRGDPANRTGIGVKTGEDLFASDQVVSLQIDIAEEGMAKLRQYEWNREARPSDRIAVHATVKSPGISYTNVAIHLKGAAGSFRPVDDRPGLTLDFSKAAKGQGFHGLQKISLNNSVQDPSYVTDKLCREIFLKAGVPVPRASYATVKLNGRDLGLYVLTEGWNKQFLARHFENPNGQLYDCGFAKDVTGPLIVNSGDKKTETSDTTALVAAAQEPDLNRRLARLEQVLDLDRFLTFIALDAMLWNWDGYALNKNNYRLYHDPGSGRFVFFPHGMDQMFWKPKGPIMPGMKGLVAKSVLQVPEARRRYLDRVSFLMTNVFQLETLTNRVNELAAILQATQPRTGGGRSLMTRASRILGGHDPVSVLQTQIIQRHKSLEEQLRGARGPVEFDQSGSARLVNWHPRTNSSNLTFNEASEKDGSLHIGALQPNSNGTWWTTVWLEEGHYRITGRVKVQGVSDEPRTARSGAGFRVFSHRKLTPGPVWDWFPYRESRDYQDRGELPVTGAAGQATRLTGDTAWMEVNCDFDLMQPLADLEIACELRARQGEAWFGLDSLRIVRR